MTETGWGRAEAERTSCMIDPSDRWAIHELIGLYGHVIDDRRWPDLGLVFTDDIVFDATDFGNPVTTSLEELRSLWRSDESMHPLAHHATNIIVTEEDDGTVRVLFKGDRRRARRPGGKCGVPRCRCTRRQMDGACPIE